MGNRTIPKTYKLLRISLLLIRSFFFPSFSFSPLFYVFSRSSSLIYTLLFTPYCLRSFLQFFRSPHLFGKFFLPSFLRPFSRIFRLRNFLDFFLYSPLLLFFVFSLFYFFPFYYALLYILPLILLFTPSYLYSSSIPFRFSPLFYAPLRVSSPYFCAIIS